MSYIALVNLCNNQEKKKPCLLPLSDLRGIGAVLVSIVSACVLGRANDGRISVLPTPNASGRTLCLRRPRALYLAAPSAAKRWQPWNGDSTSTFATLIKTDSSGKPTSGNSINWLLPRISPPATDLVTLPFFPSLLLDILPSEERRGEAR